MSHPVAQVATKAPEFTMEAVFDGGVVKNVSLADYKGKWVVLFFYPLDFTPVCQTELPGLRDRLDEFKKLNAEVIGVSCDSVYSHKEWIKQMGDLHFPVAADKTTVVARQYGVLFEPKAITLRGTFIIDPDGVVKQQSVYHFTTGRSVDEILRILSALQTGEPCPVGWKPGAKTLAAGK